MLQKKKNLNPFTRLGFNHHYGGSNHQTSVVINSSQFPWLFALCIFRIIFLGHHTHTHTQFTVRAQDKIFIFLCQAWKWFFSPSSSVTLLVSIFRLYSSDPLSRFNQSIPSVIIVLFPKCGSFNSVATTTTTVKPLYVFLYLYGTALSDTFLM